MNMDWTQAITIIASILIPTLGGFGWLIHRMDKKFDHLEQRINEVETRLTIIETVLKMMGAPLNASYRIPKTDP